MSCHKRHKEGADL